MGWILPVRAADSLSMEFSLAQLLASILLGCVGMGLFVYGKKQVRFPQLTGGLALMIFPLFVGGAGWMLAIGAAIVLAIGLAVRVGY